MKQRFLIILIFALLAGTVQADRPDSVLAEHHSLWQQVHNGEWQNPALRSQAHRTNLSQLTLSLDAADQSDAFVLQKGTGHTLFEAEATTSLHLSSKAAVWGRAAYSTGSCRNIQWNSVGDYDLLEPYVMGDTVGGKTRRERYVIEGGYGTRVGSHWLLGGELLFRADHEYRTVDPRVRSIVTDLTLRGGAAYEAAGYRWGAAFEGNIYKQTNNVKFMRETGVVPEYQMTGIGTVNMRFSGENIAPYYEGGGVALRLSATPQKAGGPFAVVTLAEHRYERIISDNNSLPLTKLFNEQLQMQAGWRRRASWNVAAWFTADVARRLGDESIIGSGASSIFPVLGTLTLYKNLLSDYALHVVVGREGTIGWHVGLNGGLQKSDQTYKEPERKLNVSRSYGEVWGQVLVSPTSRLTLDGRLRAAFSKHRDSEMLVDYLSQDEWFGRMLDHNFRFIQADYTSVDASVRADLAVPSIRCGLFAELGGGITSCSASERELRLQMRMGITF